MTDIVLHLPPNGSIRLVVPFAYWMVVVGYIAVLRWVVKRPIGLARMAGLAMLVHLVWLLSISIGFSFGSSPLPRMYGAYALVFASFVLAAVANWAVDAWRGRHGIEGRAMAIPFGIGAALLAAAISREAPLVAAGSGVLAVGWQVVRDGIQPLRDRLDRLFRLDFVAMTAIFACAAILRVAYAFRVMTNPDFVATGADGRVYDQLAWGLAQGRPIPEAFLERFPLNLLGYVHFVGWIYAAVGHSYIAVCIVQSVLGAVACVLTYDLARRLWNVRLARIAALFAVTSFQLVFAASALGHQAVDVVLTVAFVWLLVRWDVALGWWIPAAAGVVLGAAITVRETNAFLWLFVLAWLLGPGALTRRPNAAASAAVLTLTASLVVTPMLVAKTTNERDRALLRTHLGRLVLGPGAAAEGGDRAAAPPQAAGWFEKIAANFDAQFFRVDEYGTFDLLALAHDTPYYEGFWLYAFLLAGCGICVAWGSRTSHQSLAPYRRLIVVVVVARTLPHLVMESALRHRAAIEPFLILLAAAAFDRALEPDRTVTPAGCCAV